MPTGLGLRSRKAYFITIMSNLTQLTTTFDEMSLYKAEQLYTVRLSVRQELALDVKKALNRLKTSGHYM